jgi:hypothetical protein
MEKEIFTRPEDFEQEENCHILMLSSGTASLRFEPNKLLQGWSCP